MTDLDLAALKAAAQTVPSWSGMADTPMMPTWHGDPSYGGKTHRYIALANPAAVLALIERLERAERTLRIAGIQKPATLVEAALRAAGRKT